MATFSSSDTIFASVCQRGREIFSTSGTGFRSMSDIVARVLTGGTARGMVTLTVRNSSQGWSRTSAMYLG